MSTETSQWLNTNVLIGFTDKRGRAWHYRADEQGAEPNHYPGPVPVADVRRRLFGWVALEGELTATFVTDEGVSTVAVPNLKAIARPPGALGAQDDGEILGIHSSGYQPHQYAKWLLDNVEQILDEDLHIGSAMLLKRGAVAAVQVEVPDTFETPEGVKFRPWLMATTSFDASIATTLKTGYTDVVCDNTRARFLSERSPEVKIKHTSKSLERIGEVRNALELVYAIKGDVEAQVAMLAGVKVSHGDWARFLASLCPLEEDMAPAHRTRVENKRVQLQELYDNDLRVAPWRGTAHGVVQAVNTWTHHRQGSTKGAERGERNMLKAVQGDFDVLDRGTWERLQAVIA